LKSGIIKMPTILIATNNTEDAKEVKALLAKDYKNIFVSINHDTSVQDFNYSNLDTQSNKVPHHIPASLAFSLS
jgi:hypothetical protein